MEKASALSPRQREIMELAAQGLTDKEIALRTGLSVGTLRSHWDRMRARLGASSRGEVIARVAEDVRHSLTKELDLLHQFLNERRTFVWTATAEGVVDYVNDYFSRFSGLPREAIVGQGCNLLMPSEEVEVGRRRWREAQRRGHGYRASVSFRSADGSLIPHEIEVRPLEVVDGKVARWIGTASEAIEPFGL
ncbi:PAS domain S-box protein [bacterium]|nr:MAG: PAS domain S-box protein [bacterium]